MKVLSEFESKQLALAYLSLELRYNEILSSQSSLNLEYDPTYAQYNQ